MEGRHSGRGCDRELTREARSVLLSSKQNVRSRAHLSGLVAGVGVYVLDRIQPDVKSGWRSSGQGGVASFNTLFSCG